MAQSRKPAPKPYRWFKKTFFGEEDFTENEVVQAAESEDEAEIDAGAAYRADAAPDSDAGPISDAALRGETAFSTARRNTPRRASLRWSSLRRKTPWDQETSLEELPLADDDYEESSVAPPGAPSGKILSFKKYPEQPSSAGGVPAGTAPAGLVLNTIFEGFSLTRRADFEHLFEKVPASGRITSMTIKIGIFCGIIFLEHPISGFIHETVSAVQWIPEISEATVRLGTKTAAVIIALWVICGALRRGLRLGARSKVRQYLKHLHKSMIYSKKEIEAFAENEKGYEKKFF